MKKKIKAKTTGRLDALIALQLKDISRSFAATMIKAGAVLVNDLKIIKPSRPIEVGDCIVIDIPPAIKIDLKPTAGKLDIIYENDDFLVINKPPFLPVHPSHGHRDDTLVNILVHHYPDLEKEFEPVNNVHRPGIVHRLDMNTSGLIVVTKNQSTLIRFQADIKARQWTKKYYALVLNDSQKSGGVIDKNIIRDSRNRQKYLATYLNKGQIALSRYQIVKNFDFDGHTISLVDVQIETGRTHQIRVHLLSENMPILGDIVYNTRDSKNLSKLLKIKRQLLHAYYLELDGVSKYQINLPADFQAIINAI